MHVVSCSLRGHISYSASMSRSRRFTDILKYFAAILKKRGQTWHAYQNEATFNNLIGGKSPPPPTGGDFDLLASRSIFYHQDKENDKGSPH